MELLLLFSFLIHVITLTALYKLFQNQQKRDTGNSSAEIEQLLDDYISEMKKDNDQLLRSLRRNVQAEESTSQQESEDNNEDNPGTINEMNEPDPDQKEAVEANEYIPPVENSAETYEQSLAARALLLEKEGKSLTEIAKTLDRGKGEIELLLKFRR